MDEGIRGGISCRQTQMALPSSNFLKTLKLSGASTPNVPCQDFACPHTNAHNHLLLRISITYREVTFSVQDGSVKPPSRLQCNQPGCRDAPCGPLPPGCQKSTSAHGAIPVEKTARRCKHYQYCEDLVCALLVSNYSIKIIFNPTTFILTFYQQGENRPRSSHHCCHRQSSRHLCHLCSSLWSTCRP